VIEEIPRSARNDDSLILLFLYSFQNVGGVAFCGDRVPDFFDFAVGADQKCAAYDALENPAHEFFWTPDTVGLNHFVRGIAKQGKIKFLLFAEIGERFLRIGAGAEDDRVFLVETSLCVTELGRFGGSTGSTGFGKEEQNHALAFEVLQRNIRACVALQREVGRSVSDFQHRSIPDDSGAPINRDKCRHCHTNSRYPSAREKFL
jgi:hypothetical protein